MNKLIELLNEHEELAPSMLKRKYYSESWYIMYIDEEWEDVDDYRTDYEIISKEYGFIKWLVDNDKIDRDRCECRQLYNALKRSEDAHWDKNFSKCERIVMLLAIQDSPIEYLISVLK